MFDEVPALSALADPLADQLCQTQPENIVSSNPAAPLQGSLSLNDRKLRSNRFAQARARQRKKAGLEQKQYSQYSKMMAYILMYQLNGTFVPRRSMHRPRRLSWQTQHADGAAQTPCNISVDDA